MLNPLCIFPIQAHTFLAAGMPRMYLPVLSSNPNDTLCFRFGRLDYAHLNAGIEGSRAPTHEYSTDMFDRLMAVNLRGTWLCCKYLIPLMLNSIPGTEGAIVITSSTAGELKKSIAGSLWFAKDFNLLVN